VASEGIDDERELSIPVLGTPISFSVGCFFQGNLAVLDSLASFALEGLSGDTAADLYCGVGLFGALLGARFKRIAAVESSSLSASFARRNIRGAECDFSMTVEQWIQSEAPGAGPMP
jgi:tRNA/tmRNA/rRNA uracil-C5-methylase (TrmA/RlmC/RlmD family)